MFDHNGSPPSLVEKIGKSDKAAGWARLMTVVVSLLAPVIIGAASWAFHRASDAFDNLQISVARIETSLAVGEYRDKTRDGRLDTLELADRDEARVMADHEKRIGALETQSFYYRDKVLGPGGKPYPMPGSP
jgi:hypothetical protein